MKWFSYMFDVMKLEIYIHKPTVKIMFLVITSPSNN